VHESQSGPKLTCQSHVPLWTLTQLNKVSETAALTEGQRIVIPHSVGQKLPAPNPLSSEAAGEKLPSGSVPNPVSSEATGERLPSGSAQNPVSSEQQF
jgi:hypothetical protein